ncbi:MAG: polysaccharide deacetylase family protein [Pseudomonadales bacterium]|nr:polysaccharide deacetylase family protein [Pseudomonadales bacterium]
MASEPAAAEPAGNGRSSGIVLQYHHVADDTPYVTSISPAQFREHMEYLQRNDYTIWSLDRLVEAVRDGSPVPDRTVTITFDDAYLNIYTNGFPILKEFGWPFTIFVSTEFIGTNQAQYLTWQQLEEMQQAGALIENHTHSHTHLLRKLDGESDSDWKARVRSEIVTAGDAIEENLGTSSTLFAYPYGEYNDEILEIVEDLGYVAFGQQSGPMGPESNFLALPRFPMSGRYADMDTVKTKLDTLPLPVAGSDVEPVLDLTETQPSLTLHFTRPDLRFNQLVCYGPSDTTELTRQDETTFVARAKNPVPVGRSRYNCTMPVKGENRFSWYSQLWIRRNPDGSWYPEP